MFSRVRAMELSDQGDTDHQELNSRVQNTEWKTLDCKAFSESSYC